MRISNSSPMFRTLKSPNQRRNVSRSSLLVPQHYRRPLCRRVGRVSNSPCKRGINYRCADKVKSDLYRDLLPIAEFRPHRVAGTDRFGQSALRAGAPHRPGSGKDSIDHGPGSYDDLANAWPGPPT